MYYLEDIKVSMGDFMGGYQLKFYRIKYYFIHLTNLEPADIYSFGRKGTLNSYYKEIKGSIFKRGLTPFLNE